MDTSFYTRTFIAARQFFISITVAVLAIGLLPLASMTVGADPVPKKIYFSNDQGDIHVMDPDGSNITTVGNGFKPQISPDGSKILFYKLLTPDNIDIFVMDPDGNNIVNLTNTATGHEMMGSWSPDGTKIAYNRAGNIYIMNADGSNPQIAVANAGQYFAWSPDGNKFVIEYSGSTSSEVATINIDGTDLVVHTNNNTFDGEPAWSPDGSKIVWRSSCSCGTPYAISMMDADGSNKTELVPGPVGGLVENPAWSPDSTQVIFKQWTPGSPGQHALRVISASGGSSQVLYNGEVYLPFWGPADPYIPPPVIGNIGDATIDEGSAYTTNGSFTDSSGSGSWTATVDYGDGSGVQPLTLSGTNFSLNHTYADNGSYTLTVSVTNNQNRTDTETAVITVTNVAPIVSSVSVTIDPVDVNQPTVASGSFTDAGVLDTHTAQWDWGDGQLTNDTVTEFNGSGSVSDTHTYTTPGTYTITLIVTDNNGASGQNTGTITVNNPQQLTALDPAQAWVGPVSLFDIGLRYDLRAEVHLNGSPVSSGQLNSQPIGFGFGGFSSATLRSVAFASFAPVAVPQDAELSITLSARNACTGSLRNSGSIRLWFNDAQANSQFGTTVNTTQTDHYLRNGFVLGATAGSGPKQSIDVAVGARCGAFVPFGTWEVTL